MEPHLLYVMLPAAQPSLANTIKEAVILKRVINVKVLMLIIGPEFCFLDVYSFRTIYRERYTDKIAMN